MSHLRARRMRQTLTPQEACLWSQLKAMRGNGVHWRRQTPFLAYYIDFVTFGHKLVVEVDGAHHQEDEQQSEHDFVRDKVLASRGFLTLRFTNRQVDRDLDWVMECIRSTLALRGPTLTASRSVPPDKREGLAVPPAHSDPLTSPPWPLTRPVPPHEGEGDMSG